MSRTRRQCVFAIRMANGSATGMAVRCLNGLLPNLAGGSLVVKVALGRGQVSSNKILAALLCVAVLAACAQTRTVKPINAKFDPAEYAPYQTSGPGTVVGQGFMRQQGGGVVTCAGSDVLLFPATAFTREIVQIFVSGGEPDRSGLAGVSAEGAMRKTMCDAQGNFRFADLPAKQWIVMTEVKWSVGYEAQGGAIGREIAVLPEGETKILLTDADFLGR